MEIMNYNKISVQGFTLTSWRANWTDTATEANQDNTIDADALAPYITRSLLIIFTEH